MLTVCVLLASTKLSSLYDNKDFSSCAVTPVIKHSSSFMLSSNDHILGIITRPFETALFFPPPLSILMCSCAPQGAQHLQGGNHTAFCGAELKGFTLHHFKPHFQPPHCCLCAAGESSSSLKVPYFFIAVALSNPEYSHLIFFVFPWTEMERKKNVFWCN